MVRAKFVHGGKFVITFGVFLGLFLLHGRDWHPLVRRRIGGESPRENRKAARKPGISSVVAHDSEVLGFFISI